MERLADLKYICLMVKVLAFFSVTMEHSDVYVYKYPEAHYNALLHHIRCIVKENWTESHILVCFFIYNQNLWLSRAYSMFICKEFMNVKWHIQFWFERCSQWTKMEIGFFNPDLGLLMTKRRSTLKTSQLLASPHSQQSLNTPEQTQNTPKWGQLSNLNPFFF